MGWIVNPGEESYSEIADSEIEFTSTWSSAKIQDELTKIVLGGSGPHTHEIADINGLQDALDNIVSGPHTHTIAEITGLQDELDKKADVNHTHQIEEVENLQDELDKKANVNHTHTILEIENLQDELDKKANVNHTHDMSDITTGNLSANRVTETSQKQFISATEKAQVQSNTSDIQSYGQRITDLENLGAGNSTDEMVKMTSSGNAGYLEDHVDNATIQNYGGKLTVTGLDGLTSTITELNTLIGITGNVQAQINALTSVGNFSGTAETHADIASVLPTPEMGDMVIVVTDENYDDDSTIYVFDGTDWVYTGKFTATVRDFVANPLKLDAEVTNVLPKMNYEFQNAAETPINDAAGNFTATDVEGALAELFTYANSIKNKIAVAVGPPLTSSDNVTVMVQKIESLKTNLANAITQKGVAAYPYNTLNELANKIIAIPNVKIDGTTRRTAKINVNVGHTTTITLNEPLTLEDLAVMVLEYVGNDVGVVHYTADYNNGDESNFMFIENEVKFDGHMKINDEHDYLIEYEDSEFWSSAEIDLDDYSNLASINVDTDVDNATGTVTLNALKPNGQKIEASNDISLFGVETIDNITLTSGEGGNGVARVAVSFDGGVSYHAYSNGSWHKVENFETDGMTAADINNLTDNEYSLLRGESDTVRFGYYLKQPTYNDVAYHDKIQLTVSMQGYNEIADTKDYELKYDPSTKEIEVTFKKSGTFSVTYVDGD